MLAPNPSQHLESEINRLGNLEASVRSRDTGLGVGAIATSLKPD
jgi:hypothetical protein